MMKHPILVILFFYFGLGIPASAQIDFPPQFSDLLKAAGIDILTPLEAKYKDIPIFSNQFQGYDFAIRSRKEKMEIRYLIVPYNESNPLAALPHIKAMSMVSSLASNEQDVVITGLSIEDEKLKNDFNADWGKVFFFQPKSGFARRPHCRLLALHKEGQGTAYVFFLFEKAGQELDNRFYALRFQ